MLGPDDLRHVARVTISNYDRHADDFREGTKDHDVGQNVDALRSRLEGPGPDTTCRRRIWHSGPASQRRKRTR
jgi:hypothetical protein